LNQIHDFQSILIPFTVQSIDRSSFCDLNLSAIIENENKPSIVRNHFVIDHLSDELIRN
jgi:hypothetical protein